jgi:hypothetical protein
MNENLQYARLFARFPFAVRRFVKHRLTVDDAKRIVRERIGQREANFVQMVTRSVYENPSSPYLALLKHVGCEMGDVQRLVAQNGVEGTLRQLPRGGGVRHLRGIQGAQADSAEWPDRCCARY